MVSAIPTMINAGMIKYNPPTAEICVKRCGNLRTTEPCSRAMMTPGNTRGFSISRVWTSATIDDAITGGKEHFRLIDRRVVELMVHQECDGELQPGVDEEIDKIN